MADKTLLHELRVHLDTLTITHENIGEIRRSLFLPWDSVWNVWVRDETARREGLLKIHGLNACDLAADITGCEDWRQPRG